MRIVFCGTPEYAVPSLQALAALAPRHELAAVVSQPDRPKGRSGKPVAPPVIAAARELNMPAERLFQPKSINQVPVLAALRALNPDLLCVVAYGCILSKAALALPRLLAINAHASLLPRHRGAAPIQAALMAGDTETGVSIIKIVEKLDAGPVLLRRRLAIEPGEDAGALHDRLAALSAKCFVEALGQLESGQYTLEPQDDKLASYAPKLAKNVGQIVWSQDAATLERFIRAMNPWPGAWTAIAAPDGARRLRIRVAQAALAAETALLPPGRGRVSGQGETAAIAVGCASGALLVRAIQPEGKRVMSVAEFLRGGGRQFDPDSQWG